jgi:hypothetical protein
MPARHGYPLFFNLLEFFVAAVRVGRSSAHFTESSAAMPCTAFAYISTMMYLLTASAAPRRAGPALASEAAAHRRDAVWRYDRVDLPQFVVLPHLRRADREPLLRTEPLRVHLLDRNQRRKSFAAFWFWE